MMYKYNEYESNEYEYNDDGRPICIIAIMALCLILIITLIKQPTPAYEPIPGRANMVYSVDTRIVYTVEQAAIRVSPDRYTELRCQHGNPMIYVDNQIRESEKCKEEAIHGEVRFSAAQ